jgi:S1-C subfamily serine protease
LLRSGDNVDIKYVRDNETHSVRAILGGLTIPGEEIHAGLAGSVFEDTGSAGEGGIEISDVEEGSPAQQRGLRAGDKITHANRSQVDDLDDLRAIAERNRILFLNIHRGERTLMIQIR